MPMLAVRVAARSPSWNGIGERGQDAPGDLLGAGAIGLLQQERELVAAQAAGRVLGAQDAHQPLGHEAQQLVTGRMSERVVDGLEVVQVNEQDGQARRRCRRTRACERRSTNRTRFASPVNGSWSAWWRS